MFQVNNKNTRTYFTAYSSVSIVNFEHVISDWVYLTKTKRLRDRIKKFRELNLRSCKGIYFFEIFECTSFGSQKSQWRI